MTQYNNLDRIRNLRKQLDCSTEESEQELLLNMLDDANIVAAFHLLSDPDVPAETKHRARYELIKIILSTDDDLELFHEVPVERLAYLVYNAYLKEN